MNATANHKKAGSAHMGRVILLAEGFIFLLSLVFLSGEGPSHSWDYIIAVVAAVLAVDIGRKVSRKDFNI